MKRTWTDIEENKLSEFYPTTQWEDMGKMFPNHTRTAIKARVTRLKLKRDKDFHTKVSKFWTREKEQSLIKLYPTHTQKEIAHIIGATIQQVSNRAHKLGLYKKENDGCYKKGHTPANKGKKMLPEVYEKVKATMFKKGRSPINHKAVGSIRISVDGYYHIKTKEPNIWELLHREVWRKHNGEINTGEHISFKDGNKANISINNLEKISMKENIARTRETDGYIAQTIDRNPETIKELLKHPEIISLKRTILKLNKAIRDGEK